MIDKLLDDRNYEAGGQSACFVELRHFGMPCRIRTSEYDFQIFSISRSSRNSTRLWLKPKDLAEIERSMG
jgi:hypothetical protein